MEKKEERLRWAKSCINGNPERKEAYKFDKIYPFTTENISGYIDLFDLENKKLLTVGSSCDQIINASLEGCKDITLLDVNPYVEYYYYLKMAAILKLEREDFLRYLSYEDNPYKSLKTKEDVFNKEYFDKIKDTLKNVSYDSYYFWSELYNEFKGNNIRYMLFAPDEYQLQVKIGCNKYLQSENNYNKLRRTLTETEIRFITENLFNIEKTNIVNKFDSIWLSNIGTNLTHEEIKNLTEIYSKYLEDGGKLLISYLYITNFIPDNKAEYKPIYKLSRTLEVLSEFNPEIISVTSINGIKYNNNKITDSVLVYKKTKNIN